MKAESFGVIQSQAIQIEPLGPRDLFRVYRLERRCFPLDSWPFPDVLLALIFPRIVRLKAVAGEKLVGFVMGERERGTGWIASIGVDPDFRQRGIGTDLLRAVERELDTVSVRLCVRASNATAIRLYEQAGYQPVDTWRRYYRGGEDALVMEKIVT